MGLFIRRYGVFILLLVGAAVVITGFCYDIVFAGIPYQDAPPDLAVAYLHHARLAAGIRRVGWGLLVMGALLGVGRWLWRRWVA